MTHRLALLLVLLCTAPVHGAGFEPITRLRIDDTGAMAFDDVKIAIVHFSKAWRCSRQTRSMLHVERRVDKPDGWSLRGSLSLLDTDQTLALTLAMRPVGDAAFSYAARAANPDGIDTNQLALDVNLPIDTHRGSWITLDDRVVPLPKEPMKGSVVQPAVKRLVVPTRLGKLVFEGKFGVSLQDGRHFKAKKFFRLRLLFSPSRGLITDSRLDLTVRLAPYQTAALDLSAKANMGLRDETEGDRKGGWTDQGDNDIRMLRPGARRYGGVLFHVADPKRNAGKSCLVFAGPQRDYFLSEADLPAPAGPAAALYLLHATAWTPRERVAIGSVQVDYADGSSARHDVVTGREVGNWFLPIDMENAAVVWTGRNPRSKIGLYLSKFAIEAKPVRSIKLAGTGRAVWMVVAASAGEAVPLFASTSHDRIEANDQWRPIKHRVFTQPGSVLDWSSMADGPAGKHGRVVVRNGHFEFEGRPRQPVRFCGTNICSNACYQDKTQAEALAAELARRGYNTVRIHHYDRGAVVKSKTDSTTLDPASMDKLDYLVHCLKGAGIYVSMDLYTVRVVRKGEIPEVDRDVRLNEFKALVPVSQAAMANWKTFARNVLTHRNPHTGLAWKDDPAIFSICTLNEDNVSVHWQVAPDIEALYLKRFGEWLKRKGAAPRSEADRAAALNRFLIELNIETFEECKRFLRGLGVNALLTDVNYRGMVPTGLIRERLDYVDNHAYHDSKRFLAARWKLPYGYRQSMATKQAASTPRSLMPTRLFGKPFTVTEFNYCYPNHLRAEGGPLMGAYAALQDWDGLYRYSYAHTPGRAHEPKPIFYLDNVTDPINTLAERLVVAMFLRRDVAPAKSAFPFLFTGKCVDKPDAFDRVQGRAQEDFSRLGLFAKIGSIRSDGDRPLPAKYPFAVSRERLEAGAIGNMPLYTGDDLLPQLLRDGRASKEHVDREAGQYLSETGELHLDAKVGAFRAVTGRTECFVLSGKQEAVGRRVRVVGDGGFAVVGVVSVDGRPIAESRRLLVLHLTDVQNTLVHFGNKAHTVLMDWGELPHLVRRGRATVTIGLTHAGTAKAWAIDMSGARVRPVELGRSGSGAVVVPVDTAQPWGGCLAYEVVQD